MDSDSQINRSKATAARRIWNYRRWPSRNTAGCRIVEVVREREAEEGVNKRRHAQVNKRNARPDLA